MVYHAQIDFHDGGWYDFPPEEEATFEIDPVYNVSTECEEYLSNDTSAEQEGMPPARLSPCTIGYKGLRFHATNFSLVSKMENSSRERTLQLYLIEKLRLFCPLVIWLTSPHEKKRVPRNNAVTFYRHGRLRETPDERSEMFSGTTTAGISSAKPWVRVRRANQYSE